MESDRTPARMQDSANPVTNKTTHRSTSRSRRNKPANPYEHLPTGIVEISTNDRFLSVNAEFCRLLGYERQELLLLSLEDVTHRDDYAKEVQLLDQLITGEIPFYKLEKRFICRDGQTIWTEITRSMDNTARANPAHTIGVVLDITERQRAEGILAGLTRQQQALYQLADQLTRTNSLEEVLKAALDAILTALQCDRASILLLDEKNTMRFVAWHGLSDEYRKATDGHSPWKAGDKHPTPISVSDVHGSNLSDSLKAVVQREGIGSLAFIPLVSDGILIGKFMIYFDAPHEFTEKETELSLTVARQLAATVDRKRAEEALRTSAALYRAIARNIPGGGVYVVNKEFRFIVAEGIVTEAFDLTRETLEGHTIYEALSAEQSAKMQERLEQNFAGETVSYETKYQGRVYWTQQALLADPPNHVIIVTLDITERKQMEEALRDSEARFRALLNQATAGIVRKRLDGTLLFVNHAFSNMLGYKSSELVGKPIWEFTHPDDVQINKKLYAQLMLDGLPFQLEKRLIRQDGSILWVNASVSPIMDAKGKPQSAVAVEVDITARKQAEEALQELNLQLESLVEKRTAQLKFANQALQRNRRRLLDVQEEERRALARELHDRVGQSLTALNLNLSILQGQLPDQVLAVVGSRLADSIGLLDETIPAVRDVMSNLRPTVLDEYGLEAALRMYLSEFTSRHGIQVGFSSSVSSLPRLETTIELTLLRIAQEALFNIAKHARASAVQLSIMQVDSTICFTAEDNGVGFEMLGDLSHRDSHGLNIMRERAEAVGGSILITSAIGEGTRIEVTIPYQPAKASEKLEENAE